MVPESVASLPVFAELVVDASASAAPAGMDPARRCCSCRSRTVIHTADDEKAAVAAKQTQDALIVFRATMGAFLQPCSFLSQIFNHGAIVIEARSIFYRRLIPLLAIRARA